MVNINLEFDHAGEMSTDGDVEPTAALVMERECCKSFFIFVVYVFYLATLVALISFIPWLHELNEEEEYKTYMELSEKEALLMVGTWYLSIFAFGWIVINEIRIVLIAKFAPAEALVVKKKCDELDDSEPEKLHR